MSLLRHLPFVLPLLAVAGCKSDQPAPTTAPKETWTRAPMAVAPNTIHPVKEGTAPLVYLVEAGCMVRIRDMTTNEDLISIPVPNKTVVNVNPRVGIVIGTATMKPGPLPADHHYAIFLESAVRDSYIERGTLRPGQPPPGQGSP